MPAYHSNKLSNTDRPDYNYPLRPNAKDLTPPFAPRNLFVTSPYDVSKIDIRWDNPKIMPSNSSYNIVGCNVYRATDNPYGPYVKINDTPVTVLFYRDETKELQVTQEDATPTLKCDEPDDRWLIYVQNNPIVKPGTDGKASERIEDVEIEIDSGDGVFLPMPAYKVYGFTGEVELISFPVFNHELEQIIPPRLPKPPNGRVRISYTSMQHTVITVLNQRIYYKVTAVAVDPADPSKQIETPLEEISERSAFDIEAIDYIWREAILRNRWILDQGGERVKLFVRKWMGEKCTSSEHLYGQSFHDCPLCYGTGIMGGYDGPYDCIIAPPETEKMVELADMGLHIRYDWTTWMTDYPLINPRDVVVRQNNERYVIGPVNPQGQRGAIFQQHFSMSYVDQGDIRYQISITGGENQVPASYDKYREDAPTDASPVINDKSGIPEERAIRGRTVTFENITF